MKNFQYILIELIGKFKNNDFFWYLTHRLTVTDSNGETDSTEARVDVKKGLCKYHYLFENIYISLKLQFLKIMMKFSLINNFLFSKTMVVMYKVFLEEICNPRVPMEIPVGEVPKLREKFWTRPKNFISGDQDPRFSRQIMHSKILHSHIQLFCFVSEQDYPPEANAGNDMVIRLPNNSVVLNGGASKDDKVNYFIIIIINEYLYTG